MTWCIHVLQAQTKNSKIIEFWPSFQHCRTHTECQAVHKNHDFEWNYPTVPDWASQCALKTHSQHCKASPWYPVTLTSVSTPLFKQHGRRRGEENCWPEVRGLVISRDLAGRKRKTGWKFCRNASHIIFFSVRVAFWPQTVKKGVVGHERKIE